MLKNTKDIILKNVCSIIPMGDIVVRSSCFRLIYYLQKK